MSRDQRPTPGEQPPKQSPGIRLSVNQIIAALVFIVLLVFVFSNRNSVEIQFISWSFNLPMWVALLGTAAIGAACGAAAVAFNARRRRKA